jgi:hypothetical protein
MIIPPNIRIEMARAIASGIGFYLKQEYKKVGEEWWLFTNGEKKRPLTKDEVMWHSERNHHPFIENGIGKDHPDWWKNPVGA